MRLLQNRIKRTTSEICRAALDILAESGFEGYTTNAVAKRAGVSVGSIYRYFADVDALTAAVSKRTRDALAARLRLASARCPSREAFARVFVMTAARAMRPAALAYEEARLGLGKGDVLTQVVARGLRLRRYMELSHVIVRVVSALVKYVRCEVVTAIVLLLGETQTVNRSGGRIKAVNGPPYR